MKNRALPYFVAAAISMIAADVALNLFKTNLHLPLEYRGDALFYSSVIKSIVDHGWFWQNPSLGAPAGLLLYDYPNVAHENLHLLLIKLMSIFTGDWALLLNIYFLLGFPLITLSAMAVFRNVGVSAGPAIVGSVLYSFLPSRLLKGEGHLFLDVFYQVPLAVLVLLWVCSDEPPFTPGLPSARGLRGLAKPRQRTVVAVLVCLLNACTSAYYSFFTICLLVIAGVWATIERRSPRNAIAGLALAGIITLGMAANGLPSIVYHLRHGPNAQVGSRAPAEAELYGMKIAQLLLPVDGHRVPALRRLKQRYNAGAPLVGENSTTSLGIIGSIGFLALLGAAVKSRRAGRLPDDLLRPLAVLNLGAVLLGTIGGFGSLFALLVFPQIRTYSRVGVLIGFFSLFAVALLLERLKRIRPALTAALLPIMLLVGLFDQATPLAAHATPQERSAFLSDRDLIHRAEASVAPGTMVFALPYTIFPEAPPLHHMLSYDLLRPYLHSSTLRFSLPTMSGRSGDTFVRTLSHQPADPMLQSVAGLGFGGILVNRDGYPDDGVTIEADLRARLTRPPLVSQNGRLLFFDLAGYRPRTHTAPSPGGIDRLLRPLAVTFGEGFFDIEPSPRGTFRWASRTAEISVENDAVVPRRMMVRAIIAPARAPARLIISGDLMFDHIALPGEIPFARAFDVPPGRHVLRFSCDSRLADAPADPRQMVWHLDDFDFEEVGRAAPPAP